MRSAWFSTASCSTRSVKSLVRKIRLTFLQREITLDRGIVSRKLINNDDDENNHWCVQCLAWLQYRGSAAQIVNAHLSVLFGVGARRESNIACIWFLVVIITYDQYTNTIHAQTHTAHTQCTQKFIICLKINRSPAILCVSKWENYQKKSNPKIIKFVCLL